MKLNSLRLKKENFELYSNTPNVLSIIAKHEVPKGLNMAVLNDSPAYIKITAKEIISGLTISESPFTVTLSHTPAGSDTPSQQGYAVSSEGKRYEIVNINPSTKQITLQGDTTASAVDLTVYYAIGEGSYQVVIERPAGSSVERQAVLTGSLMNLNSRDLYDKNSGLIMPELLLLEEWELQIQVDTGADIDMENESAVIEIPIAYMDEEALATVMYMLQQGGE